MSTRILSFFVAGLLASTLAFPQAPEGLQLQGGGGARGGVGSGRARVYPAAVQGGNYMHNYYIPPAPSSTPWAPAWAPDGKSIVVALYGSLWSVDPSTDVAKELTYGSSYHSSPSFSSDGKWIVYTADHKHQRIQLEILNTQTGETKALTDDDQVYLDPVFSPDGKSLAYVSTKSDGNFNVFVRPIAEGKWSGDEIAITSKNQYPSIRLYVGQYDSATQPAWLKDGKELLLVSNRGISLGAGGVWRVPVEPGGIAKGKRILDEQTLYRTRPDVSIDGKRFLYSSTVGAADSYHHLYVLPVDGGYPYKLTFGSHEDFHPRWSPDGESIAYVSNEGGLPQLVVMETYGGKKKRLTLEKLEWKRPVGTLNVKVVDAQTGKPVHVRIQGEAADGKSYAPRDAYSRVANQRHLFHSNGVYSVTQAPGSFKIQAIHGFEYAPTEVEANVVAGKATDLTIKLQRISDLAKKGWYNGSTHVHMNYGGNLHNTLENLVFMSKAEDQNILNELVANKDNRILDWEHFVPGGGEHPITKNDPSVKVLVGEEYRPPFYGHISFIGLKENLISPFVTGYEMTGVESLYPSNTDMFRKAIAQGAVVGYVHPFFGEGDPLESGLGSAKGLPVDAALGTAHYLEWSASSRAGLSVWHHLLNNDLRIAPVGGEDSISNLHISKLVGSVRTYAYVGKYVSIPNWVESLRAGKTFFTSGPILEFTINGKVPGEEVKLPTAGGSVTLKATVKSITPLSKVVIHHNGKVWKELALSGDKLSTTLTETIPVSGSGWYALYAEGEPTPLLDTSYPQAGTNAVRVYVGDQKIRNPESAQYFLTWIDKLQSMANLWSMWRSQAEKEHVYAQFDEARKVYSAFLNE